MYTFSPAFSASNLNSPDFAVPQGEDASASTSARWAKLRQKATQANRELLSLVVEVLSPSGLLRLLPVRYWLFITTAGLNLLKVRPHIS